VAANLERVADHAKSIAKRSISGLAPLPSGGSAELLNQLHGKVVKSLRDVLHALGDRDVLLADKVHRSDDQMDQIFDDLFHSIIADLQASQGAAVAEVQTLFVGKSLERIGDHATNIAEEIRFMTKGNLPSATREV
jgi:phosphate transport system protein